jgi:predicted CopG family antitoxin
MPERYKKVAELLPARGRYSEEDVEDLVEGAMTQQRLLVNSAKDIFANILENR